MSAFTTSGSAVTFTTSGSAVSFGVSSTGASFTVTGGGGQAGQGVPVGGAAGQILAKIDSSNYNTFWADPSLASGVELIGDVTGSGSGTVATTLADTAVTAASYGAASLVPSFTVDTSGRLTAAADVAITIAASAVIGTAIVEGDPRLGDERTPADGSVTTVKIVDANVTNDKLANPSITINGSAVALGGTATIDALPSQSGESGKYLTTNGTAASWAAVDADALPSQSGESGKYLTTNGTAVSWAAVTTDPTPAAFLLMGA